MDNYLQCVHGMLYGFIIGDFDSDEVENNSCYYDYFMTILETLLMDRLKVVPENMSSNLSKWYISDKKKVSSISQWLLVKPEFKKDPHGLANKLWEKANKMLATNECLSRSCSMGLMYQVHFWNTKERTESMMDMHDDCKNVCKITHVDTRCISASIVLSSIISFLLSSKSPNFDNVVDLSIDFGRKRLNAMGSDPIKEDFEFYYKKIKENDLTKIKLNCPDKSNFVFKTMAVGCWATLQLKEIQKGKSNADIFSESIRYIKSLEGNTRLNCAITGMIIGSYIGVGYIPNNYKEALPLSNRNRISMWLKYFEQMVKK